MARGRMDAGYAVEINMLEELIERGYAYLWHFAMAREKEAQRYEHPLVSLDSWKALKHQKQKQIHRLCISRSTEEKSTRLAKIWQKRADKLYASADLGGLLQLLAHIEAHNLSAEEYVELLKKRHQGLQLEITELRESTRRLRLNNIRGQQNPSYRVL